MKTYKETREAIRALVIAKGLHNIINADLNKLHAEGHNTTNMQNALSYFRFSPKTAKYR